MKQLIFILLALTGQILLAQDSITTVYVTEIKAQIDARTSRKLDLAMSDALKKDADIFIIDMDTYGGALNDADDMRTAVLNFELPVYIFINNNAASAGALISIASDSIYMTPGASIGAATVVTQDGAAAPDKYQSYMRSIMRSTAEAQGRDPRIAEAMVDENIEIDSITPAGEVITFSTSEAIQYDFCEGEVLSIEEILEINGIKDYEIIEFELSATEKVISLFLNPIISGLLILVIVGGIYFELQSPGVGFPLIAAITALVLYLVPYYLNGLAENWEIIALVAGLVLIAVEIFVIPGFGIAGVSGIVLFIGSMILIMVNNDAFDFSFVESGRILQATLSTLGGLLGGIIVMLFGGIRLTNTKFFNRISLQTTMSRDEGYTSKFNSGADSMVGKEGKAQTVLRPSGRVLIDDEIYDAFTRGEYIDAGEEIVVLEDNTNSLRVKKKI